MFQLIEALLVNERIAKLTKRYDCEGYRGGMQWTEAALI